MEKLHWHWPPATLSAVLIYFLSQDAAALSSTMNRVDGAVRAKAALLVACFALCECVCVYTKEKNPQIDRADLAATLCWRKGRERKRTERGRQKCHQTSVLISSCKLGQQQPSEGCFVALRPKCADFTSLVVA